MKQIVGSTLPASREATIKLKQKSNQRIRIGTPMEARLTFFDGRLAKTQYKYPWHLRVWYTYQWRHGKWQATHGNF